MCCGPPETSIYLPSFNSGRKKPQMRRGNYIWKDFILLVSVSENVSLQGEPVSLKTDDRIGDLFIHLVGHPCSFVSQSMRPTDPTFLSFLKDYIF